MNLTELNDTLDQGYLDCDCAGMCEECARDRLRTYRAACRELGQPIVSICRARGVIYAEYTQLAIAPGLRREWGGPGTGPFTEQIASAVCDNASVLADEAGELHVRLTFHDDGYLAVEDYPPEAAQVLALAVFNRLTRVNEWAWPAEDIFLLGQDPAGRLRVAGLRDEEDA